MFAQTKNIRAIHINHGINVQADDWQRHCEETCRQLKVPLLTEKADLSSHSEDACRQARYAFFKKHLKHEEILLTAHHADDQVETVLLKLLRGSGLKGLNGIEKIHRFHHSYICRPLLNFTSKQLKTYLREHHLSWIEDPSNQQNHYKRNAIRNEVLPILQQHFNGVVNNINRSANNCQQSLNLLQHLCNFDNNHLCLKQCRALPDDLQPTLLYHWLTQKNLPTPDKKVLEQISLDFIHAARDKHPHYRNKFYQLFRWKNAIHCIRNFTAIEKPNSFDWFTERDFELPNGCGRLSYTGNKPLHLNIQFGLQGQKLHTHQHNFRKTVKQLLQEQTISPWQKANTPFIFYDKQLVSLGYSWSNHHDFKNLIHLSFDDWYL